MPSDNLTNFAKQNRKNQTEQERKLWLLLKAKRFSGYKFRRQHKIGKYITDFVCKEKFIIIECDGGHHNRNFNIEYDRARDTFLKSKGYRILRFWNTDIESNIDTVQQVIYNALNNTPPLPALSPPQAGRRGG